MQDIVSVISRSRLDSYDGNTDEEKLNNYYENRCLAIKAAHKCAEIEIYLRNKFISCFPTPDDCFKSVRKIVCLNRTLSEKLKGKTIDGFISSLTFGELVSLIAFFQLESKMFDLNKLNFRKYSPYNHHRYLWTNQNRRITLNNLDKNIIILKLVRTIRNRAVHWENLEKTRIDKNNKVQPNITTSHKGENIFGILPKHILEFLDDLISCTKVVDMEKYKDIDKLM